MKPHGYALMLPGEQRAHDNLMAEFRAAIPKQKTQLGPPPLTDYQREIEERWRARLQKSAPTDA